ncbi:MAG: tetratricopeptide repeat protein [Verrucomicrobia bacterium]|nr:tetratricopeptide repeat protein [Verrucomicrobiota bacterium]
MPNSGEPIQDAINLFAGNQIESAAHAFEGVLAAEPNHAVALHFLGLCKHRQRQQDAALALLLKSIELEPNRAAFHSNLGLFFAELNDLDRALDAYSKALRLDFNSAQTHTNLGNVLQKKGQNGKALESFQTALRINPEFSQAWNNLGSALATEGRTQEAIDAFEKALRLSPSLAEIHLNLGNLYLAEGNPDAALEKFQTAARLRPNYADALLGVARVLKNKDDSAAAVHQLRQVVQRAPSNAKAFLELGNVLRESGQFDEALACFENAAALDPTNLYAQWNACLALPIIYPNADAIQLHRHRWQRGVKKLLSFIEARASAGSRSWFSAPHTNFYLHYQGFNDLAEQRTYAKVISRLASQAYPEWSRPVAARPVAGRRIKVGFISAFFSLHTVFKLFHGWIKHLNPELFETHCFHLGKDFDKASRHVRDHVRDFFSNFRSNDQIIEQIRASELDVLIYPEIGMDPVTQSLAALRLAPVQCMAWGHPVTSGLETIDYFLSSELMEGPDADSHYSEKLIRLPHLSIFYPPPDISIAQKPEGLGEADKSKARFLCLQSLFKLLPQYDDLFPKIAAQAPESEFWFIGLDSRELTELFRTRLAEAFTKHGFDPGRHLRLFPKMKFGPFLGLIREADIILDSVGWSGGNTTLEAIAFDKPIVTLPGELMRSRHTYAILRRMGVEETVATDLEDYVKISARLASDKPWRSQIGAQIHASKDRVYNGYEAVKGLERFLANAMTK